MGALGATLGHGRVRSGKIAGELFGIHEFASARHVFAYDTFADAAKNNALKVAIKR
jgi:hypothetical protein